MITNVQDDYKTEQFQNKREEVGDQMTNSRSMGDERVLGGHVSCKERSQKMETANNVHVAPTMKNGVFTQSLDFFSFRLAFTSLPA